MAVEHSLPHEVLLLSHVLGLVHCPQDDDPIQKLVAGANVVLLAPGAAAVEVGVAVAAAVLGVAAVAAALDAVVVAAVLDAAVVATALAVAAVGAVAVGAVAVVAPTAAVPTAAVPAAAVVTAGAQVGPGTPPAAVQEFGIMAGVESAVVAVGGDDHNPLDEQVHHSYQSISQH